MDSKLVFRRCHHCITSPLQIWWCLHAKQPTRIKEFCVNRWKQQEKDPASQAQLIWRSDTANPFNFVQEDKSSFTLSPYWQHSHLHCRSSSTILVLPRQTLNFQPIDSSPPDENKKQVGEIISLQWVQPLFERTTMFAFLFAWSLPQVQALQHIIVR